MNKEKYNLLKLIEKSNCLGYTLSIFDSPEKERKLRELLFDNLIYAIEESCQPPRYFLTPHGKERLEDYEQFVYLQETIDEIRTSLNHEKQDRIKADNSTRYLNIATILITSLTLAAVISGLFSAL